MRIVHVIEAFGGGTLNAVVLLANYQAQVGHQVIVVHSLRPDTPANYPELFSTDVQLQQLMLPQGLAPHQDWAAANALRQVLTQVKPDLVHLHSSKAGAIGRLAAKGMAIPVIYSPHGFSFNRQDVPEWKRKLFWLMEATLGRLPCHIMACSSDEARAASDFAPSTLIYNAVDISALTETAATGRSAIKRGPGRPPLVIAMAGRITAARNPEGFSEVARQILANRKDVAFYWLGDGDRESLDPAIHVTGWLSKADLLASLRNTDIYFHPSTWDGLPFSILEAMSQAIPVVASSVGGNKDAVAAPYTGYLADSVASQVNRLQELLDDPTLRVHQGRAGQARVAARFSLATYFQQVDELYARVQKET